MAARRAAFDIPQLVQFGVLHSFVGYSTDGANPEASLINVDGTFYGTTYGGGANGNDGTVFSVTPAGTVKVLHSFGSDAGPDGAYPDGPLVNVGGTLYGTTYAGGADSYGCVYSVVIATGAEKVVYSFKGDPANDGEEPQGGLINVDGVLYGTTTSGGTLGRGTVYSVTKTGEESVLHSFMAGNDGGSPEAGLVNVSGTLYGTTGYGGELSAGTVFSITTAGTKTLLYSFLTNSGDGTYPYAPLINVNGTLYGTTYDGGAHQDGTVFSVTTAGIEKVVYNFAGGVADGAIPQAGLLYSGGNLFGTTSEGGSTDTGDGTVFKVTLAGKETVLHFFTGSTADGDFPLAGLIKYKTLLYGTTKLGGSAGDGIVYSITP